MWEESDAVWCTRERLQRAYSQDGTHVGSVWIGSCCWRWIGPGGLVGAASTVEAAKTAVEAAVWAHTSEGLVER